jgi:methanogenic corrinoid protein MtbC1
LLHPQQPFAAPIGPLPARDDDEAFAGALGSLLSGLLAFDLPAAERVVGRLLSMPFEVIIHRVYFPALRSIGDGWKAGTVTVAQEHFASAFIRSQIVAMLLRVGSGSAGAVRVACTTFPGERHELGVLAFSVHLALLGYRVTYLGADMPLTDLCSYASSEAPDWICVSVIVPASVETITEYACALRSATLRTTRVIIGGAGLPEPMPEVRGVRFERGWNGVAFD